MTAARRGLSQVLDVAAQFSSSVVGRGLHLVLQVFLARKLGPAEFGLYAIGWTVLGLVSALAAAGMPQAVIRFGVGGRSSLRSRPMAAAAIVGLFAAALIWLAADVIAVRLFAEPTAAPVIRAFAPAVVATGLVSVAMSSLRVSGATTLSAAVGVALFALSLALTVFAFTVSASAFSAAIAYSVAAGLTLAGSAALVFAQPSSSGPHDQRALLHFGLVTVLIHGSNVLNLSVDRLVIGMMVDAEAVGIYHAAAQLAMVSVVLRAAVTTVFESRVPKPHARGAIPDVTHEFFAAKRTLLHAMAPGLIVLALTAEFWVRALFGAAFGAATTPLVVLTLGQFLVTFLGPSITALHMTGGERTVLGLTIGSLVLNILGNVVLIPLLGISGAAIATVAASLFVALTCLVMLIGSRRLRFSFDWLRDILLGTAAGFLVCALSAQALGTSSILSVGLVLVATYATYGVVVIATRTVEDEVVSALQTPFLRALGRVR